MASLAYQTDHTFGDRLTFSDFVVLPAARALFCNGDPVCIGARAFDLLVILAASQGEIVSKEAIFAHVWPTTTVDESNLRFQMTLLRKALGPHRDLIKTIPGRGYLLAADIECKAAPVPQGHAHRRVAAASPQPAHGEVKDALRSFLQVVARNPAALSVLDEVLEGLSQVDGVPGFANARKRLA